MSISPEFPDVRPAPDIDLPVSTLTLRELRDEMQSHRRRTGNCGCYRCRAVANEINVRIAAMRAVK